MPINPIDFYKYLSNNKVNFFTGVPDSLLKEFCLCVDDNLPIEKHIITANEGNAIALATGYHLATGELPMVYMQNSGLGNAINPLLSLCDPDVYSIPMLILIGWRGESGVKDEPQHIKQGKIQLDLLKTMDIPFEIISSNENEVEKKLLRSIKIATNDSRPVAILVKKGTFDRYKSPENNINNALMSREESLKVILNNLPDSSIIVSTTGKTSREIFEIRENKKELHNKDFLTVGSMGHCSSIALGIAIAKPDRKIICIDGDGSLIMHMGGLSTVGKLNPSNFYHILINNLVHESVGGQQTSANAINFSSIAQSNGYNNVFSLDNKEQLEFQINEFINQSGPALLEVLVKAGSRKNLGRPTIKPINNKLDFMDFTKK